MAGTERAAPHPVNPLDALQREPWAFDFFQALRRLECAFPDKPRIGRSKRPSEDAIRLGQEASLAFAPSTIAGLRPGKDGAPPLLSVYFLGLLGPNGPMPLQFTEHVRRRVRVHGDSALARFLDLFHHRMLSLFYRAWSVSQPAVHFDRPSSDRFAVWLGSTFGHGTASFRGRDLVPDAAKLHFAGRLASQARPAEGLEAMLEEFLGVPAAVEPYRGAWLRIPENAKWRLGVDEDNGVLGDSTSLGFRTWDRQQTFRIALGPLSLDEYERFLPGGESFPRIADLVRNYIGDELDWDVNLILARREVPPMQLGGPTRLGLTTWLKGRDADRDPADLVVRPEGARGKPRTGFVE
jgi:type VI secretion system protein ImpH